MPLLWWRDEGDKSGGFLSFLFLTKIDRPARKKKGKEREEGKRDEEGNIVPPLRAAARRCHATALSRLTYLSR